MHCSIPHSFWKSPAPNENRFAAILNRKKQVPPRIRAWLAWTDCHCSTACATDDVDRYTSSYIGSFFISVTDVDLANDCNRFDKYKVLLKAVMGNKSCHESNISINGDSNSDIDINSNKDVTGDAKGDIDNDVDINGNKDVTIAAKADIDIDVDVKDNVAQGVATSKSDELIRPKRESEGKGLLGAKSKKFNLPGRSQELSDFAAPVLRVATVNVSFLGRTRLSGDCLPGGPEPRTCSLSDRSSWVNDCGSGVNDLLY